MRPLRAPCSRRLALCCAGISVCPHISPWWHVAGNEPGAAQNVPEKCSGGHQTGQLSNIERATGRKDARSFFLFMRNHEGIFLVTESTGLLIARNSILLAPIWGDSDPICGLACRCGTRLMMSPGVALPSLQLGMPPAFFQPTIAELPHLWLRDWPQMLHLCGGQPTVRRHCAAAASLSELVDMRASFTVVPDYVDSGRLPGSLCRYYDADRARVGGGLPGGMAHWGIQVPFLCSFGAIGKPNTGCWVVTPHTI